MSTTDWSYEVLIVLTENQKKNPTAFLGIRGICDLFHKSYGRKREGTISDLEKLIKEGKLIYSADKSGVKVVEVSLRLNLCPFCGRSIGEIRTREV